MTQVIDLEEVEKTYRNQDCVTIMIVPDALREAIMKKIDKALEDCPEAIIEKELTYERLLAYFNQYGSVPDFSFQKKEQSHDKRD